MHARSQHPYSLAALVGGVALAAVAAGPLTAQSAPSTDLEAAGARGIRSGVLDEVRDGLSFVEAADHLVEQAESADLSEGQLARSLRLAGRLYWHGGDYERARRTLEAAAYAAYQASEFVLSANLYLDAAQAASRNGDQRAAWQAADRAGYVLRTADIPEAARRHILARVEYVEVVRGSGPAGGGPRR